MPAVSVERPVTAPGPETVGVARAQLLLVEDDDFLREALVIALRAEQFDVAYLPDGRRLDEELAHADFVDLVTDMCATLVSTDRR